MACNKKFFHPYARVTKISSYEEAKKFSVNYDRLKELALRPEGVKFWMVSGLANSSYTEEAFTNKDFINKFEPSDIGKQIGYLCDGPQRRCFIDDIGLGNADYNRHLVFLSKHLAKLYENYQKTSVEEQMQRDEFLDELRSWDTGWDTDYDIVEDFVEGDVEWDSQLFEE